MFRFVSDIILIYMYIANNLFKHLLWLLGVDNNHYLIEFQLQ